VIDNVLITFSDMTRSEELKLYYLVFEECFLKEFKKIKFSKRSRISFECKSSLSKKQNKLLYKFPKLCESTIYLEKKISFLSCCFCTDNVEGEKLKLEAQLSRIKDLINLTKEKLSTSYFINKTQ
jgi:hypothetical protein